MKMENKQSVIDILEELEETSGSLAKRAILEKHESNELLKHVFAAAYDPYVTYYVSKFKMPTATEYGDGDVPDDIAIESFLDDVLKPLYAREITGNAAKDLVIGHFSTMNELQQKWCLRLILKNLRCGVQDSTLNKVWPGLIKGFSVQLANSLKTSHDKNKGIVLESPISYPIRVEPKLDGLRCVAVKKDGSVTFFTRNGTVLETMPKIKAILERASYDNAVLDGEAMGNDWNESASVLMSKKGKKDDCNIIYNVFDTMLLEDWTNQKCAVPFHARAALVEMTVKAANTPHVRQVPHITAASEKELMEFFKKCMDEGYEGVMLKDVNAPYYFKRSDAILKLKPFTTFEGMIVDHYEGRRGTKREGIFGGFDVVMPNGIVTRVGGGFNDVVRAEIQLEGPDSYIGKIIEVEGQPDPLTKDGLTVDGRIRFPVFTRFRSENDVDQAVIIAGNTYLQKLSS